ncbi:hypothetical protein AQUCO_07200166v1 [Aquilegia coerulea]|uniref:Secreted protein n=1 Tax=Aquilegia coerulea TaxID=218851 RepID=A0A2G5CAN4_AQUCA|nr:hypothetical protein AQUCO_32200002v1 [Aquilegia coerulea]PIA28320.1 hypothetical protein AQUCO_07200166v1 [Aquilegia coerulea]
MRLTIMIAGRMVILPILCCCDYWSHHLFCNRQGFRDCNRHRGWRIKYPLPSTCCRKCLLQLMEGLSREL